MLAEKLEHGFVTPLVFLGNPLILEVGAGSHPTVDLVAESLDMLVDLEAFAKLGHVVCTLILGSEHADGHVDLGGIGRVEEGRVGCSSGLEGMASGGSDESGDLASPAKLQVKQL